MTYYFDMDGVLVEFSRSAGRQNPPLFNRPGQHYFLKCTPDQRAINIMQTMLLMGLDCRVLSRLNGPEYMLSEWREDKKKWLAAYIPSLDLDRQVIVTTGPGGDVLYDIPDNQRRSHVLIDDYNPSLREWEETGGISVKYGNKINTPNSWNGLKLWPEWSEEKCITKLAHLIPHDPFRWLADQAIWITESFYAPPDAPAQPPQPKKKSGKKINWRKDV